MVYVSVILQLDQSLVPDDPRFAKLQLEGSLPMLNLNLSDRRLTELVKLLVTLPFPKADVPDSTTSPPVLSTVQVLIFFNIFRKHSQMCNVIFHACI